MTNTNLEVIEVNSLIPVAYLEREKFFLNENDEVESIIKVIKDHYSNLTFDGMDGSTEQGRKAIKKVAAELNNKIKEIDAIGKSVTDILKAKPTKIDAGRKIIRDSLGLVYETIRKPVVEWEAEQARIKAEAEAKAAEEQRKKDEELADLRAKAAQQEREKQVAEEAANKAKLEAENRVKEAELKIKQQQDEIERKERERVAAEQQKQAEEARRLADVEHRKRINNEALSAFTNFGIAEETAKDVIKLIIANKIPNITINY